MNKNYLKLILFAVLAILPLIGQKASAQVPANCSDVMLQAFDYYPQVSNPGMTWNDSKWTTLNGQAAEIGASFQMIWLPPSGNPKGGATNMGYLPVYWFDQTSSFGSQTDLKTLIATLKTNNCKAIADIVVNHRNGENDWCNFATETYKGVTYTPNSSWICTDDESRAQAPAGCNNPQGAADTGEKYDAGRDLDHTNASVRTAIKAYLDFMKNEIGYSGWRYDVAAGFGASYVGEYDDAAGGYFSVGEVLKCDYTAVETWINGTGKKSTAFDFPFQCSVRDAFNNGDLTKLVWKFLNTTNQPAGLIHNPDLRRYATTFIENHDTYRYGLGFYGNIQAANAFMLGSPGVPCVYLAHWKYNKTAIQSMIAARKKAGLHSQSAVVVLQTATNIYVGEATGTNGKLIVKVGSGSYSAPAGYTLECSGTDWAMWTNVTGPVAPILNADKPSGTYLGGTNVTLSSTGGTAPVKIYYTTNNTTPSASSTEYKGTPISITVNNTILRAVAIDNASQKSNEINNTYLTEQPAGITVTFVAPATWTKVSCYVWKAGPVNLAGAWPGTDVTASKVGNTYKFTVTDVATLPINVIFNNSDILIGGIKEQTVDLSTSADICWSYGTGTGTAPKKYSVNVITCSSAIAGDIEASKILIYPNPARESITIESELNIKLVQFYTIYGALAKAVQLNATTETININDLTAGYYSIVVTTENGTRSTSKLIKQ